MEGSWERADLVEPLHPSEIAALISDSGLAIVACEPIREGLANANYRVVDAEGTGWVLRRYRRDPGAQDLEVALLRHFAGTIPVPSVRYANSDRGVVVLQELPGRSLQSALASDATEADEVAPSIGRALATLSSRPYEAGGFLDGGLRLTERWPTVYDGLFGFLDHGLGRELAIERAGSGRVARVRRAWRARQSALRAATERACLAHGDFKPANLLVQNGHLTGVLDWEFAHAGTWLLDPGSCCGTPERPDRGSPMPSRRGGPRPDCRRPPDWEEPARLVDTASLVDFLGRPATGKRQTRDVLALLDESLAILDR